MVDPIPLRRLINWERLRSDEAERIIKERAADSDKVDISLHAYDRVEERSILAADVFVILRQGMIEGAARKNEFGDWEATMVKRMPGRREAGVVTIIFQDEDRIFVKTVQWMDWTR